MLRAHAATGAAIVVPVVIYPEGMIHAAGNMEYPNHVDGVTYVHKEHRYYGMPYDEGCDLPAVEVDYAESHCFLADVDALKAAGGFDEELVEFGEVDTGRRVRAIGRSVWVEPAAVVHTDQDSLIELEDVEVFRRRWDPQAIARSRQRFMDVWKVDVGEEGRFDEFVSIYNSRLGLLPRRYPRPWTVVLDRKVHGLAIRVRKVAQRTRPRASPDHGRRADPAAAVPDSQEHSCVPRRCRRPCRGRRPARASRLSAAPQEEGVRART